MDPIYLHLGAGNRKISGFINIDIDPGADLQLDLTKPLPWPDRSVAGIFSEHFIEHITQADAIRLLHECHRMLQPGATLRISTPDLQDMIADYMADRIHPDWEKYGMTWTANRCERFNVGMRWWGHQWIYDEEELARLGLMVGFELKGRFAVGRSQCQSFDNIEYREAPGLILEFLKPERMLAMDALPLVSIVIPTYKPDFFAAALQSAIDQTYRNTEILICDDCPDDSIKNITERYADNAHIRYIRNPERLGRGNLIKCVTEAAGEFIKILNDDDLLAPRCIESMLNVYRICPDVALVTSRRTRIDASGHLLPDIFATLPPVDDDAIIEGISVGAMLVSGVANFIGEPSTVMFRKKEVAHLKPDFMAMDEHLVCGTDDMAAWANLSTRGNVAYLVTPQSSFRIHAGQNQQTMREEIIRSGLEGLAIMHLSWERRGLLKGFIPNTVKWKPLRLPDSPWALRKTLTDLGIWEDVDPLFVATEGLEELADRQKYISATRLMTNGNTEEGLALLLELVTAGSDFWPAYNDLASYAQRQGDSEAAIELLRQAAMLSPASVASTNLAKLLIETGHIEEADSVLATYLAYRPADSDARLAKVNIDAARQDRPDGHEVVTRAPPSASVVVTVPIYKERLEPLEEFSLDRSLSALARRKVVFFGPDVLDRNYYEQRYPNHTFVAFPDAYFASAKSYSKLLLSEEFYQRFSDSEFVLILQTDAIVFRDELDHWCAQPYDYIGAPWPNGYEIAPDNPDFPSKIKAAVGNGGLSLRRTQKCLSLLREFPEVARLCGKKGANEDMFFALLGTQSAHFNLPDELTASRFSLEEDPRGYIRRNGSHYPMGAHQWWIYDPALWEEYLGSVPPAVHDAINRLKAPTAGSSDALNLHIGGKEVRPGWKILNIQPAEGVDYVGDVCDLSQFPDQTFDNVYASHVFEHIRQTAALPTLQGIHRILKRGGCFYISVPDLGTLAKLITSPNLSFDDEWHIMRMMFGGQTDPYDFHYCGWTFSSLSHFLRLAGFDDIHRVTFFNLFNDASCAVKNGTPISLNLIAKKP